MTQRTNKALLIQTLIGMVALREYDIPGFHYTGQILDLSRLAREVSSRSYVHTKNSIRSNMFSKSSYHAESD